MRADLIQYLSFNGNCEEAMKFYQAALGGELSLMRASDAPPEACPEGTDPGRVFHAQLRGEGWRMMASDIPAEHHVAPNPMVNLSLNVYTEAEGLEAFEKLSAGGTVFMPMQKTFWAESFGMFRDKFGFSWMVNYEAPRG